MSEPGDIWDVLRGLQRLVGDGYQTQFIWCVGDYYDVTVMDAYGVLYLSAYGNNLDTILGKVQQWMAENQDFSAPDNLR